MSIRVRYAPSPTGFQHVGGLRTALFNYLFARSQGGVFYLRLEDTDRTRYNPDAEQDLYQSLRWAGIEWDEGPDKGGPYGPYVQSQRLNHYHSHANTLIENHKAYRCFCTSERLDAMRKEQEAAGQPLGYDRKCRSLDRAQIQENLDKNLPYVVRFMMPLEGDVVVQDNLLGQMTYKAADLPTDPVLLKSDGFPTYHLAHVVDDYEMKTSHVIRSQEWLPSLGLHCLLFQAFGWEIPIYLHLPMVMGTDGQKLSKRHGATAVRQFQEGGYLPEALVNGLALLGWSYNDSREIFSLEELEKLFSLEGLQKSPAVMDYKKLEHFNGLYIRALPDDVLLSKFLTVIQNSGGLDKENESAVMIAIIALLPHLRDRVVFVQDVIPLLRFIWEKPVSFDPKDLISKKGTIEEAREGLQNSLSLLSGLENETEEALEAGFRAFAEEKGKKLGELMMPLRVAVMGGKVSLPLFPALKVLGLAEAEKRVGTAIEFLESQGEKS